MSTIHHALVLNLHQPAGNLWELLRDNTWEAKEILYALDRIPRSLWQYENIAKVSLSLSGTLQESLSDPEFQKQVYGVVDCGSLLWHLQNTSLFNILGTGYYHPVLPLLPEVDRKEQLQRWRGIGCHLFNREIFQGFWPPELGFSMEMIPLLKQMGYRYVIVDSEHVEAVTPMSWYELRYQPHTARYNGDDIIVIVRDRDLSNAQESGMELAWFENEVDQRTKYCDFTPLVTTATDGDNGGWFRNPEMSANFWGFYCNLLNKVKAGTSNITPCFIDEYLDRFGAVGEVHVNTGAWNTGWHHGRDFTQWTGSEAQKSVLSRIALTSLTLSKLNQKAIEDYPSDSDIFYHINEAKWRLLRSETSCNIFWGEAWVPRAHADLEACWAELNIIQARMNTTA
jgi:alpha-amylase/alpha-mannosidase (GH57 family)